MMKSVRTSRFPLFLAVLGFLVTPGLPAEVFSFQYAKGDQYRILSTVDENVYINGELSHRADILNKIAVTTLDANEGSGRLAAVFQTSERSHGQNNASYHWAEEYRSEFVQDALGRYTIHPDYYMPVLRDVPVFPAKDLVPGDTWVGRAEEVHDLRRSFGIAEAFHIPITVSYEYLGKESLEGKEYDAFTVSYTIFHKPQTGSRSRTGRPVPVLISGFSRQLLYWNSGLGRPYYSTEDFDLIWELSNGDRIEYTGTAEGRVIESPKMDRNSLVKDIQKELDKNGVTDTKVSADEKGVTITLEDIQFLPDSAVLIGREKTKLDRIGEILSKFPERDIMITGHTALAGTPEGRKRLSEERARSVGDYLRSKGVSSPEHLVYRGMGADVPVADNTTEAGKRRNRRVEITILEN